MADIAMTTLDTRELAELLEQKRRALEQLEALCRRQQETIEKNDWDRLMRILTAKQKLLTALETIERQLDRFRREDPRTRQWSSEEAREACRRDAATCESLWASVIGLEQQCGSVLETRRRDVARQLAEVHRAADARSAYLGSAGPLPSQVDLQAE